MYIPKKFRKDYLDYTQRRKLSYWLYGSGLVIVAALVQVIRAILSDTDAYSFAASALIFVMAYWMIQTLIDRKIRRILEEERKTKGH